MYKDSDRYFRSISDVRELAQKTSRGGLVTVAGQGVNFILKLGSTMMLARLLVPGDFGLYGMVLIVLNFVQMFKDFGLSQALIQRPRITREEASNLFWVNVGLSIVIAFAVAACGPLLAKFYGRSELALMTVVMAGGMLISGFGLQHRALLIRNMHFGLLAIVETLAMVASIVVALTMAWLGFAHWALVSQALVVGLVGVLGLWSVCRWVPGLWDRGISIRPYLKYGGNLAGFNLLNFFSRNADNMMIGYVCGAGPLGLYTKAYDLLMLPLVQINGPMTKVMLPALSRLLGDDEAYRRFYLKAVGLTISFTFPIVGAFLVATKPLVLLFLGDAWLGAVPIFLALVPAAFVSALNVTTGWVFQSRGTTDRQLKWTLFAAPLHVLAMFIGLQWGAVGVAWGVSLSFVVVRVPYWCYTFKGTPVAVRDVAQLVLAALCVVVPAALFAKEIVSTLSLGILSGAVTLLALYGLLLIVIDWGLFRRAGLCFRLLDIRKYI